MLAPLDLASLRVRFIGIARSDMTLSSHPVHHMCILEPPVLTCPTDVTVNNENGKTTARYSYVVSATDNVGVSSTSCNVNTNSDLPLGDTQITCTATDVNSIQSTCTWKVTVVDTVSFVSFYTIATMN
jgi:hypothetical protein